MSVSMSCVAKHGKSWFRCAQINTSAGSAPRIGECCAPFTYVQDEYGVHTWDLTFSTANAQ